MMENHLDKQEQYLIKNMIGSCHLKLYGKSVTQVKKSKRKKKNLELRGKLQVELTV